MEKEREGKKRKGGKLFTKEYQQINVRFKNCHFALTGVAQSIGCCLTKRKVTSSTLGQGICLGCRFCVQEATN